MPRRRRRPRRAPTVPVPVIHGLSDAIATAASLAERFTHGHAVVVIDARGTVVDMWVFRNERHTAEDAIRAGLASGTEHPVARSVVLVSVLDGVDLSTPNELEVEMWRITVDRFSRAGLDLSEWVMVSGELIRSLSVTAETEQSWRSHAVRTTGPTSTVGEHGTRITVHVPARQPFDFAASLRFLARFPATAREHASTEKC